ncbi:TPR end-of-group domain-containing protein [Hymenobacter edaphi]|uniref:Tetratricopeptide repeat protein n=1 Tax=Hymenobacter edaphi TaxID=2211146 RepID=A0A328BSZ1_9BACT|nr:hypothetical protein [Hymenobacter edaphi]RAK69709.1 hypothetical protein DLM85_02315 [Hymenobacter edaphi]
MPNCLLPRLLVLALLLGAGRTAPAQTTAQTQHQAVEALYPVMLQAVKDRNFAQARALCLQAIGYEPREAVHRYNLACIEALAGAPNAAFAALNQATALGYADVGSLRTDADLAAVRADSRFAAVLQAAARNASGTPAPPAAAAATVRPVGARPNAAPAAAKPAPAAASAPRPAPAAGTTTPPVAAKVSGNKPVGLFFMTRYWISNGALEKHTWYFAPDGRVYVDPPGFSAAELAAHRGERGSYQVSGGTMTVKWAGGSTSTSTVENPQAASFTWDMGNFTGVRPFASSQALIGSYEGGESLSSGLGSAITSRTLTLRPDGTFSREGVSSFKSTSDASTIGTGAQSQGAGRWQLNGYFLTLTDGQGQVTRGIIFPFNISGTAARPDRLYFNGTMYKRQ